MLISAAFLLGLVATPPAPFGPRWRDERVAEGDAAVPERDRFRMWEKPGGGMTFALAVDPSRPATVYAGTERGGIFKSTDAGRKWRRM